MGTLHFDPPYFAFDIETIPDVAFLRKRNAYPPSVSDKEIVEMEQRIMRQQRHTDFFPLHLQKIAVISAVLRKADDVQIFSLPAENQMGNDPAAEAEAIRLFFGIIDKYQPQLLSWNGNSFDLPILTHRAFQHGIAAPTFWYTDSSFKFNNYLSRFHEKHLDLMDCLALYQPRGGTPLDEVAQCCGLPGKIGIGGAHVWRAWQQNEQQAIRHYCETDALLTYLLGIRFQHLRGMSGLQEEYQFIADHLQAQGDRWKEFLDLWKAQ